MYWNALSMDCPNNLSNNRATYSTPDKKSADWIRTRGDEKDIILCSANSM